MSKQSMEFKAEVRQILDLMIHSLYSHREVFLRELISNASDAIDKVRYMALTDKGVMQGRGEAKIKLTVDTGAGTLTVSDNGVGLDREDAVRELGTIARSGTAEFLKALKESQAKDNPELIGQFGVGFYASFMVADRVVVESRKAGAGPDEAIRWESTADGTFTVEDITREAMGTDVTLHMREDARDLITPWQIRSVVRKYSDYIEHPVVMDAEREEPSGDDPDKKVKKVEEETLNSRKAIWLKRPAEVTDEEYEEFYKHVSHDFTAPLAHVHYRAEGTAEFSALLYIPKRAPFDIHYKDFKVGPTLYVKRVQIMNNCELLVPTYLRFLRGVVDSADLPLNVSREMLQSNAQAERIKGSLTKKILDELRRMRDNEYEKYVEFYRQLGRVLKEGVHVDAKRKEDVAALLLFESTTTDAGTYTMLEQYVDRMKPDQEEVYYIVAASRAEAEGSPYLESFRARDIEVLILTDEIDDIIMGSLGQFKGKQMKSVTRGSVDVDKDEAKKTEEAAKQHAGLMDLIKDRLKEKVKDVRFSGGRLKDSLCCLVGDEGAMDHQLEQLMKAMGQEVPADKRILEINPNHPVVTAMQGMFEADPGSALLGDYVQLLYDQAVLFMGMRPEDPTAFAARVARLMAGTHGKG